jgi:GlpG protein
VAYLLTQGISTHVEPVAAAQDQWDVWVRDEDKSAQAKSIFEEFMLSPNDPKYADAIRQAKSILQEQKQKELERRRNIQIPSMLSNRNLFGRGMPPLTLTLIVLCCAIGILSGFQNPGPDNWFGRIALKQLKFVDLSLYLKTGDPAASLKLGELWRIFTPAFLHGDAIHLLLNMLSLASLGKLAERLEGTGRYAIIVAIVAMASHLLQGLMPLDFFGSGRSSSGVLSSARILIRPRPLRPPTSEASWTAPARLCTGVAPGGDQPVAGDNMLTRNGLLATVPPTAVPARSVGQSRSWVE